MSIVNPAQDALEIKCHDDYKWASIEISRLRERIAQLEAVTKERDQWQSDARTMKANWDAACTDIESLTAKLEAATAALEEIQLVSYQRYGGIVTVDIANAALKSIKAASGRGE